MSARLLRLSQIIGDKKRGIPSIIPISRASWYAGVKTGKYPAQVHLGPRTAAWLESDVMALITNATGK